MKLVLFDIDGTILKSGGIGRVAMEGALTRVFGSAGGTEYHYDGKTDRQIVREVMRLEGRTDADIDARMTELIDDYVATLRSELAKGTRTVQIFPGIVELLDRLEAEAGLTIGLLTGNVEAGARAKLGAAGLDFSRFRVNAFGSDHEHRPELPAVAQQRARAMLGDEVQGNRVIVIGDTPADITCGRTIGAKAIGVATGRYSVNELNSHGAYAVFETLADTDAVMERILNA